MSVVSVDMEIKDGAWNKYVNPDRAVLHGFTKRIGVLPEGMKSGAPSFAMMAELDDGSAVIIEASWKSIAIGMVALIARWGTP